MSYPGSKGQAGTWQRIIGQMPPHSVYVEPFFGSGQVFHKKRPAAVNVVIDVDAGVFKSFVTAPIDLSAYRLEPFRAKFNPPLGQTTALIGDSLRLLGNLVLPADALIYCDPPYPLSTKKGRRYYDHELTDDQHAALLSTVLQVNCRVLISGVPCDLYSSWLRKWRCLSYWTMTRGGKKRECLWANFPEPELLHDWRFAGHNYRQRTALKRVVRRFLDKLDAMPPRKRGYVLDAIEQRHFRRGDPQRPPTPFPACGAGRPAASETALRTVAPKVALTAANADPGAGGRDPLSGVHT